VVGKGVIGSIVGVAAVAFVLVVSGCGGGGGSSLSKAEYAKKADEICTRSESERQEIITAATTKLSGKKITSAQQEELILEVIPGYEKMTSEIDELGTPEGAEKKAEAWVEAMEEAAENVKADPGTAITGNAPFQKSSKLAGELGAKQCG
jgi:hypothetical protein